MDGNRALTKFVGSECLKDYISRMVLRRISRIDTVQDLKTVDDVEIRVKGLAIVSRKAKTNVLEKIRTKIKDMLKEEIEKSTVDQFIKKILSDEIKNRILQEIRKIYPVRNFEIRKSEVLSK